MPSTCSPYASQLLVFEVRQDSLKHCVFLASHDVTKGKWEHLVTCIGLSWCQFAARLCAALHTTQHTAVYLLRTAAIYTKRGYMQAFCRDPEGPYCHADD